MRHGLGILPSSSSNAIIVWSQFRFGYMVLLLLAHDLIALCSSILLSNRLAGPAITSEVHVKVGWCESVFALRTTLCTRDLCSISFRDLQNLFLNMLALLTFEIVFGHLERSHFWRYSRSNPWHCCWCPWCWSSRRRSRCSWWLS